MAESYRGLTIRIGGDTTELKRALRAANQASSQTAAELRKIGQAVKLDPDNVKTYNTQLGYLSNQASNAAMRLHQLKEAQEQLQGKEIKVGLTVGEGGPKPVMKTIQEIIDEARAKDNLDPGEVLNVSKYFAMAGAELRQATESLSGAHTEVTEFVAEAAKVEQLKLKDALDIASGLKDATTDVEELRKQFEKLPDGTARTEEQIDAIIEDIERMAGLIEGTFNLDTGEFDTKAFEAVIRQLSEEMPDGVSISEKAIKRLVKAFSDAAKSAEKMQKDALKAGMLPDGMLPDDKLSDEQKAKVTELQAERDDVAAKEEQNQASLREAYESTAKEAVDGLRRIAEENESDRKAVDELKRSLSEMGPVTSREQAGTSVSESIAELDELATKVNEHVAKAQAEGADLVNEAIERGNRLIDEATSAANSNADAIDAQTKAQQRLNQAHDEYHEALDEDSRLYEALITAQVEVENSKADKEYYLEEDVQSAIDQMDEFVSATHKAEEALRDALNPEDDNSIEFIRAAREEVSALSDALESELSSASRDVRDNFSSMLDSIGDDEAHAAFVEKGEELSKREDELSAEVHAAWSRSYKLIAAEAARSYEIQLENATKVREAAEQYWMQTGNSYFHGMESDNGTRGIDDAVEQEIDAAKKLLGRYRDYYKDTLASLRREMNNARKDGNTELAAKLRDEISSINDARSTIVSQLQSQISKLETELKNVQAIEDVRFNFRHSDDGSWLDLNKEAGIDLASTPVVELQDTIKKKIAETNELRDAEARKIEKTTAALRDDGATQEEIAAATYDSVEKMEQLNERAALLAEHLAKAKSVSGQLFTEALSKAQTDRKADDEVVDKVRAEVHEKYAAQIAESEEALADAQEKYSAAQQKVLEAEQRIEQVQSDVAAERADNEKSMLAVEDARTQAAKMRADAEEEAAKRVSAAISEVNGDIERLSSGEQGAELVSEQSVENARRIEEIEGRIAERQRQAGEIAAAAEGKLADTSRQMEESAKGAADNVSRIDDEIKAAKTQSIDFGKALVESFSDADERIGDLVSEVFKSSNGNVKPEHIREILIGIAEETGLDIKQIDALVSDVSRLAEVFAKADTNYKKWLQVTEFEDLMNEVIKGEAQLKDFSKVLSDIKVPSTLSRGMGEAAADAQYLKEAFGKLMSTGSGLSGAFVGDPTNVEALEAAMRAYSAATLVAEEESERLAQQIRTFEAAGITRLDGGARSAHESLLEAGKAAEEARENFSRLDGEYAAVETRLKELDARRRKSLKDDDDTKKSYKEDADLIRVLTARMEELAEKREAARAVQRDTAAAEELAKEHVEYEQLINDAIQLRSEVTKAKEAAAESARQKMAFEMVGDTSAIGRLGGDLDAAMTRARALVEALKLDPTNMELMSAKTKAFEEVAAIAAKRTALIQAALGKLDASAVDRVRVKFGSVEEAVRKTSKAATESEAAFKKASAKLSEMLNGTAWEGMEKDILRADNAMDSELSPAIVEQRDKVLRLRDAWNATKKAMEDAVSASLVDSLNADLGDTHASAHYEADIDEAAYQQVIERIAQYAQEAGRYIVESANTIDAAYRDMRKTVQGTEQQFEEIRKAAIQFSQTHAVSADQMLEMEALGGQLGIAVSDLQKYGEIASNLTIATDIGAEDVALQLGQVANIMSDINDTDDMGHFADSLVRLGNNAAAQESAIMNVAQRIAAVGNVTSMSSAQVLAWSAAVAETGQRSESAATAIVNTIEGIGNAVNAGGDTLEQFASIANMSADEFSDAWRNSSSDALEAFVKGLATLTDDSTAAIAALDSVGISSVRQETALLALSQTVGNLHENMEMAESAWMNGGDAAQEAARKSEGFSGSLQILKNNTSDLAASLGDGLIPAMNIISTALSGIANFLDGLPGPIKSAVVEVGGATIAVGLLATATKILREQWAVLEAQLATAGILKTAIIEAGQAIAMIIASLKGFPAVLAASSAEGITLSGVMTAVGTTARGAAAGVVALGKSLLPLAVITAIISVIQGLVGAFNDWREHVELVEQATTGLSDTLDNAQKSYASYAESIKSQAVMTSEEIKEANEEFLESQKAFVDSISSAFDEAGKNSALADHYASVIEELGNKGSISRGHLIELKDAVEQYNSITGASVAIIDETTGALNIENDAIREVTDAYKEQAEQQAYLDLYKEAIEKRIEAEMEVQKWTDEGNKILERRAEVSQLNAVEQTKLGMAYNDANTALEESKDVLEERTSDEERLRRVIEDTVGSVDDEASAMSAAAGNFDDYGTALVAAGMSTDEFASMNDQEKQKLNEIQAALAAAGDSLVNYGNLNKSQLSQILAAWTGSVPGIQAAIRSLGTTSITPEVNTKPSEDALRNFKNEQEATYTAAKREQEDYYNNEKAMRDHAYDDYKRQLDNEYDSLKTNLDHEYDARKSELDKEYSEAKSASDKYLKQFKAAQDQAVKDFKAATDERLEILKKEYETKKKLIEDETTSDTSDVDDRINALKAETQAEKDADEQRKRQDKVSELATNVARAKTAKKRAEAEKALNEYIAEIEQENRQRSREDLIDALEDEKDAIKKYGDERQQILTDSYNDAVEKYKTMREQQLEVLTAANEAEYEQEKELESAKLENRKAANDAELKSIKENNDAILKSTKDANDIALKAMKEQHDNELTAIKRETEDVLSDLKNSQEAELALYKETGRVAREEMSANAGTLAEIAKSLWESGRITGETYQAILQGLPEAIGMLFTDLGTTVDGGLAGLAQMLLDSGQITRDQYNQIIGAIPTDAEAAFANAGVNFEQALSQLLTDTDAMNKYIAESPSKYSGEASKSGAALGKAMADSFKGSVDGFEDIASGINAKTQRGLAKDSDKPVKTVSEIVGAAVKTADSSTKNWDTVGSNFTVGLANGIGSARGINAIIKAVDTTTAAAINRSKSNLGINSPSRVMRALGIYIPEGLALGIDDGSKYVDDAISDMSSLISDAQFADINQQIVDSMQASRDKLYAELREQADRMARILEDGFDPRLTVDAAYEAMDRIDEGRARMRQATQQITNAPVININNDFTGITVRDEADIDALSAEFERRMRRIIASQIG